MKPLHIHWTYDPKTDLWLYRGKAFRIMQDGEIFEMWKNGKKKKLVFTRAEYHGVLTRQDDLMESHRKDILTKLPEKDLRFKISRVSGFESKTKAETGVKAAYLKAAKWKKVRGKFSKGRRKLYLDEAVVAQNQIDRASLIRNTLENRIEKLLREKRVYTPKLFNAILKSI